MIKASRIEWTEQDKGVEVNYFEQPKRWARRPTTKLLPRFYLPGRIYAEYHAMLRLTEVKPPLDHLESKIKAAIPAINN